MDATGRKTVVVNEARILQDLRAVTSMEAAFDTAGYARYNCSHVVIANFVHLEDEEQIRFSEGKQLAAAKVPYLC